MKAQKLRMSYGNTKLPKTTAIFNMGAAHDCPSDRLGLCKVSAICYAKKAERMYRQVLPYRRQQAKYWLTCTAEQFAADFRAAISRKRNKITALRFNESGDFYGKACVAKLRQIAEMLPDIKIYMYTARRDLWDAGCFVGMPDNVTINGSGFMAHNEFIPVTEFHKGPKCPADCRKCRKCQVAAGKTIQVKIH